ncbi:MAG: hypothetical protein EBZ49_02750 [Proteobacteria bacterium]|nr:hypothetical protein [Pseudomonadota bacterium]
MRITVGQLRRIIREAITRSGELDEVIDYKSGSGNPYDLPPDPEEISKANIEYSKNKDKLEEYLRSIKGLGEQGISNKLKEDNTPPVEIKPTKQFKGDVNNIIQTAANIISNFEMPASPERERIDTKIYVDLLRNGIDISINK